MLTRARADLDETEREARARSSESKSERAKRDICRRARGSRPRDVQIGGPRTTGNAFRGPMLQHALRSRSAD